MNIKHLARLPLAGAMVFLAACSTMAPTYQPDFGSVNSLKNSELLAMRTGKVTLANTELEKVTIRGGTMLSPYNSSYAGYYQYAIDEQLKQARLFDPNSPFVISCVVTRNDLDGSGSSTGTADLAAMFTATKNGAEVYKKTLSVHHEWPSSFVGAIAIPNAQQGYMASVQELVSKLFSDPEFLSAVAK